jgi:hypothetical protein
MASAARNTRGVPLVQRCVQTASHVLSERWLAALGQKAKPPCASQEDVPIRWADAR